MKTLADVLVTAQAKKKEEKDATVWRACDAFSLRESLPPRCARGNALAPGAYAVNLGACVTVFYFRTLEATES